MRSLNELVGTLTGVVLVAVAVGNARAPVLEVGHRARTVQPGEAVVIEVSSSEPLVTVRATAFGSTTHFFSGTDDVWLGLIGIDLDIRPDEYAVAVRATTGSGETIRTAYTLAVEAKEFQTRRLSVNPNFVNPPADVLERIQREAARQAEIFGTSSEGRRWRGGFLRPVRPPAASDAGVCSTASLGVRTVGPIFDQQRGHPSELPTPGPSCSPVICTSLEMSSSSTTDGGCIRTSPICRRSMLPRVISSNQVRS